MIVSSLKSTIPHLEFSSQRHIVTMTGYHQQLEQPVPDVNGRERNPSPRVALGVERHRPIRA
jgi:hypothetical protein